MGLGRTLLAGIAGGIGMYIWASLAHVVLPLGSTGVQEITTNEPAFLAGMQSSLGTNSGLYLFPSTGLKPGDSSEQRSAAMKAYDGKLAANPSGLTRLSSAWPEDSDCRPTADRVPRRNGSCLDCRLPASSNASLDVRWQGWVYHRGGNPRRNTH
jgi:hypothetical protein